MKAYIFSDLEGVAGVSSFDLHTRPEAKYYEQAKLLLTGEVNAACQALVDSGITEIIVNDGHGPGAIVYEKLHSNAMLIHGRPTAPTLKWIYNQYTTDSDFVMLIGQHAMAGTTDGNLNHTQCSKTVDYYKLNGKPIGEIGQIAYSAGYHDMPLIFISGDLAACREARDLLPEIVTAEVKYGLGRNCAISVSIDEAHKRIKNKVTEAVNKFKAGTFSPLKQPGPYEIEIRFFSTDSAEFKEAAGYKRIDSQTVKKTSDNIMDVIF